MVSSSTAVLAVADVAQTVAFYKDVLGFESSWMYGDPPNFAGVNWANARLMFCLQPELAAQVQGHQHWIDTDEVDALYEQHCAAGAKIISPLEDKPWGFREYTVEDPNGYHLRFAGHPRQHAESARQLPEGIQILRQLPTPEEHLHITRQVFENDGVPAEFLERTWQGITAYSPEGTAIASLRITYDAPGWFSVWDVGVLPEWQGQRIGEAMMKEAIAAVNEESPGAFVFLFTVKPGFYEKLGFEEGKVTIRRA